MKTVTVKGTIIIPGVYGDFSFYLLESYSLMEIIELDLRAWIDDSDVRIFHVAADKGKEGPLVVKGPFVLSFVSAGKEIQIKEESESVPAWKGVPLEVLAELEENS